ncbi:hypothetical protein ACX80U_11555 [Arthrobacter sp. TmT3-37]
MLDEYVQQWSAIQTVRASGLGFEEVYENYFGIGGDATKSRSKGI